MNFDFDDLRLYRPAEEEEDVEKVWLPVLNAMKDHPSYR